MRYGIQQRQRVHFAHYLESVADRRHQEVREALGRRGGGPKAKPSWKRDLQRGEHPGASQSTAQTLAEAAQAELASPTIRRRCLQRELFFQPLLEALKLPLRPQARKPYWIRR